jgi:methionyl-tRNA synthetase
VPGAAKGATPLALAREANGYLDRKASWFQIKEDRQAAAKSVYVILRVVDNLKTPLFYPINEEFHSQILADIELKKQSV